MKLKKVAVALMKSWWEKVEGGDAFDVTKAQKMCSRESLKPPSRHMQHFLGRVLALESAA